MWSCGNDGGCDEFQRNDQSYVTGGGRAKGTIALGRSSVFEINGAFIRVVNMLPVIPKKNFAPGAKSLDTALETINH